MKIAAYTPRAARYEIGFVWFSSLNLRKVWKSQPRFTHRRRATRDQRTRIRHIDVEPEVDERPDMIWG